MAIDIKHLARDFHKNYLSLNIEDIESFIHEIYSQGKKDARGLEDNKPDQYAIGIDTFERMEANCTKHEILAFCKGNIDKYNWRDKNQDLLDFKKIIDYAKFAIKQLK